MNIVYTLGYTGLQPTDILREVISRKALLVDIRFSPASRNPQWSGLRLRELVGFDEHGDRYRHVKDYGNVNYRTGGPISLLDPEKAATLLLQELNFRPVILLCACQDYQTCHRLVAARHLASIARSEIIHLPIAEPPAQATQPALFSVPVPERRRLY